jgi:hypothetical protein
MYMESKARVSIGGRHCCEWLVPKGHSPRSKVESSDSEASPITTKRGCNSLLVPVH